MQFLVLGRMAQPTGEQSADQISWVKDGIKQFEDDPRTKAFYGFAGEWGGCIICECNTASELDQYLTVNPLSLFTEWEVHPLETPREAIETLEMVEKHLRPAA